MPIFTTGGAEFAPDYAEETEIRTLVSLRVVSYFAVFLCGSAPLRENRCTSE